MGLVLWGCESYILRFQDFNLVDNNVNDTINTYIFIVNQSYGKEITDTHVKFVLEQFDKLINTYNYDINTKCDDNNTHLHHVCKKRIVSVIDFVCRCLTIFYQKG